MDLGISFFYFSVYHLNFTNDVWLNSQHVSPGVNKTKSFDRLFNTWEVNYDLEEVFLFFFSEFFNELFFVDIAKTLLANDVYFLSEPSSFAFEITS